MSFNEKKGYNKLQGVLQICSTNKTHHKHDADSTSALPGGVVVGHREQQQRGQYEHRAPADPHVDGRDVGDGRQRAPHEVGRGEQGEQRGDAEGDPGGHGGGRDVEADPRDHHDEGGDGVGVAHVVAVLATEPEGGVHAREAAGHVWRNGELVSFFGGFTFTWYYKTFML